jgi:hypothetical protein
VKSYSVSVPIPEDMEDDFKARDFAVKCVLNERLTRIGLTAASVPVITFSRDIFKGSLLGRAEVQVV